MSASRSRTMPLIASSLLFVSFLFATMHLGEGLKCYGCNNVSDKKCESGLEDSMLFECPPPVTTTTSSTTQSTTPTQSTPSSSSQTPSSSSSQTPSSSSQTPSSSSQTPSSSSSQTPSSSSQTPSSSSQTPPSSSQTPSSSSETPRRSPDGSLLFNNPENNVYANEGKYGCYYVLLNVATNVSEYSLIERGCSMLNTIYIPPIILNGTITNLEYKTCESDGCNSSGGIQIGVLSLFLPLIASLLVTR